MNADKFDREYEFGHHPDTHLPDSPPADSTVPDSAVPEPEDAGRGKRIVLSTRAKVSLGVLGVIAVVVLYLVLQFLLPRWWGEHIGSVVGNSFTTGIFVGLGYGLLSSVVPIVLVFTALIVTGRWQKTLRWLLSLLTLAALIPTLLTLSVVVGRGSGANTGRRNLDLYAPGFRGATVTGVIIGIVIGIAIVAYLLGRRRHSNKKQKANRSDAPTQ